MLLIFSPATLNKFHKRIVGIIMCDQGTEINYLFCPSNDDFDTFVRDTNYPSNKKSDYFTRHMRYISIKRIVYKIVWNEEKFIV